jgi:hypothetical protein
MSQMIEIPDDVFDDLAATAEAVGMTPAAWIASQVGRRRYSERPLSELLEGLVGVIDSSEPLSTPKKPDPYAELLFEKFAKQGLRRP